MDGSVALDDEPFAGLQFLDLGRGGIGAVWMTGRSEAATMTSSSSYQKQGRMPLGSRAMKALGADDAPHDIAAVPVDRGAPQDIGHVDAVGDEGADFRVFVPCVLQCAELLFDLVVQEAADLFENGHGIGLLLGVLSELRPLVEELVDIGQVEVAGEGEGVAPPVVLTEERVDAFDGVAAIVPVAQMAQEDLLR